jgi:hypothetical protein
LSLSRKLLVPLLLAAIIAGLWAFPKLWYTAAGEGQMRWLAERSEVPGWTFRPVPVDEAAEKVLVADRTVNGAFTNANGSAIMVFSAKRYEEKANEIGLFIHTPDRCWVETGWKIEPDTDPTYHEITLHGLKIPVERRVFTLRGHRELVYFFGLQGGRPLPYRLDHYLSTGLRAKNGKRGLDLIRVSDTHFWSRLWDSFTTRRELLGPKQFVRISTEATPGDPADADQRLQQFLAQWLFPADYQQEKEHWKVASKTP